MAGRAELETLRRTFPLSARWREVETFAETVKVGGVAVHLVGLVAKGRGGQSVTGSAAELAQCPIRRAYFELLERTTVADAMESAQAEYCVWDAFGNRCGTCSREIVYPVSEDESRWRYARSNGVAVGRSWGRACANAAWELTERDRILRSWYGESPPVRTELPGGLVPDEWGGGWEFEAYGFDATVDSCGRSPKAASVAGVFAFPRIPDAPLAYGFGARDTRLKALAKAARECVQRLGFLWGEQIPVEAPVFAPSPDFHQEFYLRAAAKALLKHWLSGEHASLGTSLPGAGKSWGDARFVDLTRPELRPRVTVVKAIGRGELPLVFGHGHPRIQGTLPKQLLVHPIV